jgi:type IX secretion system PorP/SprF family membrane protein
MRTSYPRLVIVTVLLFCGFNSRAQYDAMFTQFMYNEMFINPGYAGSREAMSATLLHRQQWVNFPGRPVTTTFSLHGPLAQEKMGAGLSVLNEKLGVLNRSLVYGNYAYRIKTGAGRLSLGLMAGVHNQAQKFSDLKTSRDGSPDPQVAQNANLTAFNFGAGLYYSTRTFYTGLSIPRFLDDRTKFENGTKTAESSFNSTALHYYFMLGKVFELQKNVSIKTQGMLKAVSGAPVQADINANILLMTKLWIGAGYRSGSAVSALFGLQVSPQLFAGYSYDIDLTGMRAYNSGSHEIVLSYLFLFDLKKVLSPRYF